MKDQRIILSLAIVLFISVATIMFVSNSNQIVELTEEQRLFNELSMKDFGEFASGKYFVKENYISKIAPDTKVEDFVKDLNENVLIYENDKKVINGIIKTGMILEFNDMKFILLVTGDLNNDGRFTQIDLNRIIRNIGKENIEESELTLSDLNDDGLVTEADADLGAEVLLGKKLKFKDSYKFVDSDVIISGAALGDGWYSSNVTVSLGGSYSSPYDYEVYGTKEIEKARALGTTMLSFDENGAYLVIITYVGGDGRIQSYSYLIGIDKSRTRCNELGAKTLSECMLVNDDSSYTSVENAKSSIKKKTTDLTNISTTDEGLLSIVDKDGDAFYYRGDVKDNFVEFAGKVWRIVRRNGDGSVRLVYNGTSTATVGTSTQVGTAYYGVPGIDFKYIGYRNNTNLSYEEVTTPIKVPFYSYTYFYDSYVCNDSNDTCTVSGNSINSYSDSSYYDKILNGDAANGYKPYKYFTVNSYVSVVFEVVETVNGIVDYTGYVNAKYFGYLKQEFPNNSSVSIKNYVDSWYVSNLLNQKDSKGNKWSSYLADNYFCDDKSWQKEFGSLGSVYFGSYDRIGGAGVPSLVCPNETDEYTVTNGELQYPIGLLTADDVALAGGRSDKNNSIYWLYTGQSYWTLSSASIWSSAPLDAYAVGEMGNIQKGVSLGSSGSSYGVRPVINLSKDILISGGDGTADSPYQVSLNK